MRIRAMKKQSQNKPNLLNAQMNVTSFITKDYENVPLCRLRENKPKTNPIPPAKSKKTTVYFWILLKCLNLSETEKYTKKLFVTSFLE